MEHFDFIPEEKSVMHDYVMSEAASCSPEATIITL
jgi:hypothetical protein